MFAFPIALMFGIERFSWRRVAGLCLGLVAILLLVGPEASLPDRMVVMFIPIALIAPVFYAFEGNYVAKWGGLDPVQALLGASLIGSAIGLVLALASGQFIDPRGPWGVPDYAFVISSFVHAVVYTSYIRLAGRAGPVFATQVAYLVTLWHDLGGGAFGGNLHALYLAGLGLNAVWYFPGAAKTFFWLCT